METDADAVDDSRTVTVVSLEVRYMLAEHGLPHVESRSQHCAVKLSLTIQYWVLGQHMVELISLPTWSAWQGEQPCQSDSTTSKAINLVKRVRPIVMMAKKGIRTRVFASAAVAVAFSQKWRLSDARLPKLRGRVLHEAKHVELGESMAGEQHQSRGVGEEMHRGPDWAIGLYLKRFQEHCLAHQDWRFLEVVVDLQETINAANDDVEKSAKSPTQYEIRR